MTEWWQGDPIGPPQTGGDWWKADPVYKPEKPGVVEDVAKSVPAGLARGVAGVVGLPGFIQEGADYAASLPGWTYNRLFGSGKFEDTPSMAAGRAAMPRVGVGDVLSAENATKAIEAVTGPIYKPQTLPGEVANTVAEFAPGAVLGGGTAMQRAGQVIIPALASEAAGQATRQVAPAFEPAARAVAGLAAGVGTAIAQRPNTAGGLIREAAPSLDNATITAARQLMDDAAAQGVALTWPEVIQQVSGGATRLADVQRVVENSTGGGGVMRPFMAERAGQVEQAGNTAIGALSDVPLDPVITGMRTQAAAEAAIADRQAGINAMTRPAYQAAEPARVGPQVHAALTGDPLYARTLQEVRNNPALNATVAHLPDDAVGVIDLVQRRLRETAENARVPGQATTSNLAAANLEGARAPAIAAAETATGGVTGPYARAREVQAQLRHDMLEPMVRGPTGQIAAREQVMEQARALLPNQPAAGLDAAVSQTVRQIVRRDPDAAQNLVRTYAQTVFDEAIQNNAGGPNAFGGAKFAAVIIGNPQQARNLEAAVRALPNGHQRWEGFRRFLDVVEATGQRRPEGSATAFNQAVQDQLKRGGAVGEAAAVGATGGVGAIPRLRRWYDELRMGRNTEALARIFTDPASEALLRRLAQEPAGSGRAQALALRLTYLAGSGERSGSAKPIP